MNKYLFGVEIECIVPHLNFGEMINTLSSLDVRCGHDSSIQVPDDYKSLEIQTNPLSLVASSHLLIALEQIFHQYGVKVNDSCGLHVHTSTLKFSESTSLKKIFATWVAVEDVFFATQPISRLNSKYCKRRLASYVVSGFPKLSTEKEALLSEVEQSDRYYALNFNSIAKYGTLECRLHAGTLNAEKIINWIKLLKAFYSYALNRYNTRQVNAIFQLPTSLEKITTVWELLELPAEIRSHFDQRIDKYLLSQLSYQHQVAQEVLAFKKTVKAQEATINKEFTKAKKMRDRIKKRTQLVNQKASEIENQAKQKNNGIYNQKEQLMRKFVGEEFRGDPSDFIHPFSAYDNRRTFTRSVSNSIHELLNTIPEDFYGTTHSFDHPQTTATEVMAARQLSHRRDSEGRCEACEIDTVARINATRRDEVPF